MTVTAREASQLTIDKANEEPGESLQHHIDFV